MDILLLVLVLIIGFVVAFAIGTNDETMSPAVGARVFSLKTAIILGGLINIIGAISLGEGVSETVGSDLVGGLVLTTAMVFAILISMAIWLIGTSITKGLPISTTQCVVGAVIGVAIFAPFLGEEEWGITAIQWNVVFEIFVGWVISPIIGFLVAGLVFAGVRKLQARAEGLSGRERQEEIAGYGLALFLIISGLSRGGNDVANAIAPLITIEEFQGTVTLGGLTFSAVIIPLLIGGIGMAIGLATVGRKVIKVLATEVVTLSPSSALAASVSLALVMLVGTSFGLPLSGTHVLVAALIGVGWVSQEQIKKKQVKDILISWVITVPISAGLGIGVYMLTNMIF
ncbi:MAG: inorganic phosphate transporter [Candidatus Thorarchaeota archaeon]